MSDSITPTSEDLVFKGMTGRLIQDSSCVYLNLGQEIIITTEDKIRLCLIKHLSQMETRKSWIAPLGILATIALVIPTTTFRDALFLKAEIWNALFVFALIICAIWLGKSVWAAMKSSSMDDVVAQIKQSGLQRSGESLIQLPKTDFPILSGKKGEFAYDPKGPWQPPVICDPVHAAWIPATKLLPDAQWVWIKERPTDQEAQTGQFVWHRLPFTLVTDKVEAATLTLWVDDFVKLIVNQKLVRRIAMSEELVKVDLKPYIRSGENIILMEIENQSIAHSTGIF